ncbi:MAG TPA: DUF1553 domain-containing protein [Tepidisphaeraceae bacterium]|jgi:hypothetical protein|nr:DUF1553 domain-containing protein [Tepidisphaeraceae bacterium]
MNRVGGVIIALSCVAGLAATDAAHAGAAPDLSAPQYWSYRQIQHPIAPRVRDESWPSGDIDRFILANLESRGLQPAPDATPGVLIRRLYFDLVGVPPTPEAIGEFTHDPSADRVERLVDKLLASPRFGQRWGRHWLDVARFGESLTLRGFLLKDAWRYRDYVIDAFNRDRPFDQFMREQVAGDLLPADSIDDRRRQLIATEYLVLGNVNLEEQDKKQLEMDVVDEQINAISSGFLAQTIGCARCHDHKFDPISTRDYYAMAGILHSTQAMEHANVSKHLEIPLPVDPARETILKKHETAVADLQMKIAQARQSLARAAGPNGIVGKVVAVADLPGIVVDDAHARRVGTWKHSTFVKSYIGDGYLSDDNDRVESKTLTFSPEAIESGTYEVRFAYTPGGNRASNVAVTVFSADGDKKTVVDERMAPPADGHFISLGRHNFEKGGQAYVLVSNEDADGRVTADAVQFLPADATGAGAVAGSSAARSRASAANDPRVKKLEAELKTLIAAGPARETIEGVRESKQISDTRVHIRGNVHSLGDVVPRGFLHVISMTSTPVIGPGESGRRELGEWLADPQNPLPARVMANRAWHWLFGAGIVRTVDNFGTTGEQPSDPQLLDYLATRFVADKWSLKSLVRRIVLSHAYRLSSADDARNRAADPENRRVWRMNRRRLDAECIRDAMLTISGQLSDEAGGPSYKPGLTADFGYRQNARCASVYLPAFRNAAPELFEAFDCADPSVSTGRRNVSTVAPQALFMLNSAFVIDQASHAAAELLADKTCTDDASRVVRAYRLTLSREPTERELKLMLEFVKDSNGAGARDGWAMVFHALFASIDFRYAN